MGNLGTTATTGRTIFAAVPMHTLIWGVGASSTRLPQLGDLLSDIHTKTSVRVDNRQLNTGKSERRKISEISETQHALRRSLGLVFLSPRFPFLLLLSGESVPHSQNMP